MLPVVLNREVPVQYSILFGNSQIDHFKVFVLFYCSLSNTVLGNERHLLTGKVIASYFFSVLVHLQFESMFLRTCNVFLTSINGNLFIIYWHEKRETREALKVT